jgi:hypothetical protein
MATAALAPPGSICAVHAGVPAATICSRCGAFMCSGCSNNTQETLCPTCRATHGFDVQALARSYKSLVVWFGAQLLLSMVNGASGNPMVKAVAGVATLVTICGIVVYAYRTANALGSNVPVLWAIAMFVPCVNIITLLVLSSRATSECKKRNIPVGLLGPRV